MIQKENQTEYELYQGSKFYNNSFKKWLKDNNIEMYSIYSEGKNVYFDVLNDIVDKYNNIKMKPINVKSNSYADSYESNSYEMLILTLKILI